MPNEENTFFSSKRELKLTVQLLLLQTDTFQFSESGMPMPMMRTICFTGAFSTWQDLAMALLLLPQAALTVACLVQVAALTVAFLAVLSNPSLDPCKSEY